MTNLTSVSTFGWYSDDSTDLLFNISPFGWFAEGVIITPKVCDSWQNSVITAVRILVDDEDGNSFTDDRLEDIIALAASMVTNEVPLTTTYSVGMTPPSIIPDPLGDLDFLNLITLKAACLLDKSTLGYNSLLSGLGAKCGPSEFRTYSRMDGFGSMIDNGYCLSYENAKRQYMSGNRSTKKATLSPFINSDFDPTYYRK